MEIKKKGTKTQYQVLNSWISTLSIIAVVVEIQERKKGNFE